MVILKYGDMKKVNNKHRWKSKCYICGCKVIIDEDDTNNLDHYMDICGYENTRFHWTCPYCQTDNFFDEPDSRFDVVRSNFHKFNLVRFMDDHFIITMIMIVVLITGGVIGSAKVYVKYMDNHYNYRIEWTDLDQDNHTDWTNQYEIGDKFICFYSEDGHRKIDKDMATIIDLKEEKK